MPHAERTVSGFLLPTGTLCWRELIRFYRQRSRVVGALGTPVVFWLLLGSGIGTSFRDPAAPPRTGYLEYFFPGTLLLILLFTSIFCLMSTIEDRREGFLQSVLVAPTPRASLVLGKVLGGTALAVAQALVFALLAPTVGIRLGLAQVVLLVGVLVLVALAVTSLGFLVAWRLDSVQGFHGVVNLFLIPMWVLSGALFPASGASSWVRWIMELNPLTYAMAALRHALYSPTHVPAADLPSLGFSLLVTSVFALLALAAAIAFAGRSLARTAS
ncbi:MAG: ABC transporter permease [Acidobacteria bacterium]|nr:ABC transporter permease [Acidobacteriota bacterium]